MSRRTTRRIVGGLAVAVLATVISCRALKRVVRNLTLPLPYAVGDPRAGRREGPRPGAGRRGDLRRDEVRPAHLADGGARADADRAGDGGVPGAALGRHQLPRLADLSQPEINIATAATTCATCSTTTAATRLLALAAYNGGETNVDRWLAQAHAAGVPFARRLDPLPADPRLRPARRARQGAVRQDRYGLGSASSSASRGPASRDARYWKIRCPVSPRRRLHAPAADQPRAIEQIAASIEAGDRFTTLLGATGTGKTMTMAGAIQELQRPALVIAHNKTLAAQLCNEFRTYFPENAVEYFVSYYDYYQPEAYVAQPRPLHREGLLGRTRRSTACATRPRRPCSPSRRDRRGLGVVHLRTRLAGGL